MGSLVFPDPSGEAHARPLIHNYHRAEIVICSGGQRKGDRLLTKTGNDSDEVSIK